MVLCMKTTVEIPDELLIRAKQYAARERTTLRRIIEQGLRIVLGGRRSKQKRIRWVTVPGGMPVGLDVSNRETMTEWLLKTR